MRCTALLLTALAGVALAVPAGQRNACADRCEVANTFTYESGQSYVYEYSVTTSTALLGTYDDDAHMHITANAHIDVTTPCEYVLRLTDVSLDGSSHGPEFAAAMTKSPLRFAFQDGHVESLCSEVSEPVWVLNFKRGVLSTFQNSMTFYGIENVEETDISGVCQTHYNSTMEGDIITIDKVKDLASCTHRPDLAAYIPSSGYMSDSPVQSLPLFKSTSKCHQRVEEGVLKMAECEETHMFRPFSSDNGGAMTTAKTTMFLTSQERVAPVADFEFSHNTMIFEKTATNSQAEVELVEKILNDLEVASHDGILPEVPGLFATLVSSLKELNYPQLSTIYNNAKDTHSRKFVVDAMPLVGTAASFGVVRDMFNSGEILDSEADAFFTSLAFQKNPTSDMFTALASLLENSPSQKALLGTSALVNTFCKVHTDCESDSGVQQVIRRIETQLGSSCRAVNDEDKVKVLVALKALGNTGHFVNANSILRRCYTEDNNMEIRVAAIEAWRHTPCEYDRSHLLAAFQDETQDTEIRIAAYLALMTCPNPSLIDTIKDRLTSEGVNQVGSFIWTHMTNMQESAAPGKQWVRQMIGEELLQKKFSTEALKFSRNYESSFFMNELNTGAAVESNVIFSSKSYLPRSAMLNLTLDLFGQSINFFEVGGRIEGFEAYAERFFGPNGYYPEETVESILRNMHQNGDAEATTLEGFLDKVTDEPEGSYYLRVFGNEIHYQHFNGLENMIQNSGASNPLEFLMDLARKGDVDYTKSYQLMDTRMTIPTVTGLPITLSAKGTATLAMRMNGNFKARSLSNVNIEGHFHPSAAVQIDGMMLVDAHVARTGLKLTSNLHTSTYLDGKLQINGGRLVDVAFNTPKDKVEVINVKTEFFYLEDDQEIQKNVDSLIQEEACTSGLTGVALCGGFSYTPSADNSPRFPLVGPFGSNIHFKKTDTQTGYILRYTREDNQIEFLFDTPGSQADHKVSLILSKAARGITVELQTPFKSFQGSGEYIWQKNNKNAKLTLTADGNQQYSMETGLRMKGETTKTFEPTFVLTSPSGPIISVEGKFQADTAAANYVADLSISDVLASPLSLHTSFEGETDSCNININFESPMFDATTKTHLAYGDSFLSSKLDAEYSVNKGNKYQIHHTGLLRKEANDDLSTYSLVFNVNPTENPDLVLDIDFKTIISNEQVETIAKLVHGSVNWNLEKVLSYTNQDGHRDLNLRGAVTCPQYGISKSASYQLKFAQNYLTSEFHLRFTPDATYNVNVALNRQDGVETTARIVIQTEKDKASVEFLLNKLADGHYKVQAIAEQNEDTWVMEGIFNNKSVAGKVNTVIDASIKCEEVDWKANLGIYADTDKATVNLKTNIDSEEYFAKIEGTRTSILIDANLFRHIALDAYVTNTPSVQKMHVSAEWDKNVDATKAFIIDGQLKSDEVKAEFKYGETELSAVGKLIDNGVEMEAKWAADKKVFANVHYTLGNTKSLAVTVHTPFQGWEKQDASVSVTLKEFEIESSFTATWKNTQQMAFSVSGKVQPGLFNNALTTKVSFTSSCENFERITFSLDHNMADLTINTNMEGIWGQDRMVGQFQLLPNDNGLDARASFTSPITQDALVTLHHSLANNELLTTLEAKYGEEVSTVTIKGHFDLSQAHDISVVLKVETPVASIPEIDANLKYSLTGDSLNLVTEGKIGEKKVMLNVNGQMNVSEDSTDISGDLRFITPFTYPLTATLKHIHDRQHFTTQFEMTRIWSDFGSIKVHGQGHFISKEDIELNFDFSSPVNNGSLSFIHKIANNKMTSSVDARLNAERIFASMNGVLDTTRSLANLEAELTSTFNGLDDIKVHLDSEKEGNARSSKVILMKGDKSVTIDHVLAFSNLLNWENSFMVNNIYKLNNKQNHVGSAYKHELEYMWAGEEVRFIGSIDNMSSGSNRKFDIQAILVSPWTEEMKLDIHHEDDGLRYEPRIVLEYEPGMKIELDNIVQLKTPTVAFSSESTLTTPFWQPLTYKFSYDFSEREEASLLLMRGANKSLLNVGVSYDVGMFDGDLSLESTYLTNPVSLKVAYDNSAEKKIQMVFNFDKKYEITGTLFGNVKEAKASLVLDLPFDTVQKVGFSGEYHIETMPFNANAMFLFNNKKYEVNGKISSNDFNINVDLDGKVGSLEGNWNYEDSNGNIHIQFQSPFTSLDNMAISGMYDSLTATLKLSRGSQEISFAGKLENQTIVLEGTTPFSGWETLNASFFASSSAINAFVSRNDRKIEVTGSLHVKTAKGKINLTITTPYAGYETISIDTTYNMQGEVKNIEFKSTFGSEELSLKGEVKTNDIMASEMSLNIVTPFEAVKTLGGEAHWDMMNPVKKAEVKAFRNDDHYEWQLEAASDSPMKGYAKSKIVTPITGWTTVNVEGNFDYTNMPFQMMFTFDKEGVINTFEGQFSAASDAIFGDFKTPITGWETISLNGDYHLANNELTGNVEIIKGSDKYEVHGTIAFNTQKPKLNLTIKTPIAYAAEIQLELNTNFVDTEKTFHIAFMRNEEIYSVDFTGQVIYKIGYMRLATMSPIPGFTSLNVDAKYDFTGDIKTAEANVIKEGTNQHISVAARVNDNSFHFDVQTPFTGFESIKMDGDYTYNNNKHSIFAGFEKNTQKYDFHVDLVIDTTTASLTLTTPIEEIKKVVIMSNYELIVNGIEGSFTFERNNDKFAFNTRNHFTPATSDLHVSLDTPVEGWRSLVLDFHYDILNTQKSAEIFVKKETWEKKVSIEASYSLKNGLFKVQTPIEGFEVFGAEYTLDMDDDFKKMDASIKIMQNSNEWTFGAYGQYSDSNIIIKFQTPFEGFNTISIEGNLNFDEQTGEGVIQFGSYKFTTKASYSYNNMSFSLTTPFEMLKVVSLIAKYNLATNQKDAELNLTYNDQSYVLSGSLQYSIQASELSFQATTPFDGFENLSTKLKYDMTDNDELFKAYVVVDEHEYGFTVGGYIEEKVAVFKFDLKSPFSGWTDVKFSAKIDLNDEEKNIEITMEKEEDVKVIKITGKFIGNTLDFNLTSPFSGLRKFNVFGALNRSKRSVEFRMMNDAGEATLISNFNRLHFNMKTPYDRAEEVILEVTRTDDGNYRAEWKRNDNYATLEIEKKGKKNAFDMTIKSEFSFWSTQKIIVSGSGSFDTKGKFNMDIETPYADYASIAVRMDYNTRKRVMKFDASSASSDFHFNLARSPAGLEGHLLVPNPQQNTEATFNLAPTAGKITIETRFEQIRSYHEEYGVEMAGGVIKGNHFINHNGNEIFRNEFEYNGPEKKAHLEITVNVADRRTTIHFHREMFHTIHFIFKQEVSGVEKHFSVDIAGTGELPVQGAFDIVLENTFRQNPRTYTGRIEVDRTGERKKIKLEFTPRQSRLYIFDLEYDADLQSIRHGDFSLRITTPERRQYPWQNVSGNWNVENAEASTITFVVGQLTYTAQGKLTLRESTMVLSSPGKENIYLQWKFQRNGASRDYYLKLGRESRYGMLKFRGTITDIHHADIEGGIKAGPFMDHELTFTSHWGETNGAVAGEGIFNYGQYSGTHKLVKFERNAAMRSANFEFLFTSNIPQYETVSLIGNYDIYNKVVVHIVVQAGDRKSEIDISITDINPVQSRNTVLVSIPLLGQTFGRTELTLSHDFSHASRKSISAVAKLGEQESFVNAHWDRSPGFEKLTGNIEVKSRFLGDILINMDYDVSNIADATAHVDYSRTTTDGTPKTFTLKWTRKSSAGHLENDLIFNSNFNRLTHARAYANAEYGNNFKLDTGLEWNEEKITYSLEVRRSQLNAELTTPFPGFEHIEGNMQYKLTGKEKKVTAHYTRGDRSVDLDLVFNMKSKKEGSFVVNLSTPFDVVRSLHIDGEWKNKNAQVNYQRNDVQMSFVGQADIKADQSSFDISFAPPSGQNIRIAASYDVQDFIDGTGSEDKQLATLGLEFDGHSMDYTLHGFRNSDRLSLMVHGTSSFAMLRIFHLKLDSELNTQSREGTFEMTINEFEFKMSNLFKRLENNGYYLRSKMESTLTPLPALIIGLGREGEERILTIGYGDENEITFSVKGKNNFQSGFSGKVDIPNVGYEGVEYDVDYKFEGEDELHIDVKLDLDNSEVIEAAFVYNSEGVHGRLMSPLTGGHALRVRRSVSSDGFYAEAGLDDYNIKFRGGFTDEDTARGLLLEGEVFGKKFLVDTLFQSEGKSYSEGKLIVHTPFEGLEKMGGLFTWSNVNKKIMAHAELFLPSTATPQIIGEVNLDFEKKIKGYSSLEIGNEEIRFQVDLSGSSLSQGYHGTLEFYTPFHFLSDVKVTGNIKMEPMVSLNTELNIIAPFATHGLKLKYELNGNKLTGSASLESTRLNNPINLDITLELLDAYDIRAEMILNNNMINAEYTMAESIFKFNLGSTIYGNERQFSVGAKYLSLENIEGTVKVILEGETHMVSGNFFIANNRIQGAAELQSALIEGERKLIFDITVPSASFKEVSFMGTYVSTQTHSMSFDLDVRTGLHTTVQIDSPLFPKTTANFELTSALAGITVNTPTGTHKVKATWRSTRRMPSDWIASLELATPLLPETYELNVILGSKHIKAQVQVGAVMHSLDASTTMTRYGGALSLDIETPFLNINKATLEASLAFESNVEMEITANFADKINTFKLLFDMENGKLLSRVSSPFIPTGLAEVEAVLTGDTTRNMQMKMALKNNEESISGVLNIKVQSPQDINTNLKITTPFKGYKKMNFGAHYTKDEMTSISVFTDKPLKFKAELHFGNADDVVKADVLIETPIAGFERIEGEIEVPLYKFGPRVMVTLPSHQYGFTANYGADDFSQKMLAAVTIDETVVNGDYYLRTKAPYELAYGYHVSDALEGKFHIRTDSSFVSVFA